MVDLQHIKQTNIPFITDHESCREAGVRLLVFENHAMEACLYRCFPCKSDYILDKDIKRRMLYSFIFCVLYLIYKQAAITHRKMLQLILTFILTPKKKYTQTVLLCLDEGGIISRKIADSYFYYLLN